MKLIAGFISLRKLSKSKAHKPAGPEGGYWAQTPGLWWSDRGRVHASWPGNMYSACTGAESRSPKVVLSDNVTQRKIQITKDSFTTIYAALTDVTRISEAAQTASDVYVKIDRQEEDRAAGPTSLTNIQTSKWPLGLYSIHSALTRHWASGAKLYKCRHWCSRLWDSYCGRVWKPKQWNEVTEGWIFKVYGLREIILISF